MKPATVGRPRVWREGLRIGVETISSNPVLGAKRLILPVSYWRLAEFAYVWNRLGTAPGGRVLDVGSPKELAYILARNIRCSVVTTDILSDEVRLSKVYAEAQDLSGSAPGQVHAEVQDGRSLGYADDTFDAAYSVSVLEHIPDDGDSLAISELVRVVRPGGRIVVTVPYGENYREDWVNRQVYERRQDGDQAVFYQRHYDEGTLRERLLEPADTEVLNVETWGERGLPVERLLDGARWMRGGLSPFEPLLSMLFLQRCRGISDNRSKAAFFTLKG